MGTVADLAALIPERRPGGRAHRRRHEHRERHPGLPLGDGRLGGRRPVRGRLDRRLPSRPAARLALLRPSHRGLLATRAERGSRRPRRARAVGSRARRLTQNIDTLHTRGRQSECRGASRLDRDLSLPRLRCVGGARRRPRAAPRARGADVPGVRGDPQAGRRHVRRAPPVDAIRAGRAPGARGRRPRRRRLSLQVWPVAGLPGETFVRAAPSRS